jgi:hypothetical protein
MPRGRPRKVVEPPPSDLEEKVAQYLTAHCGVPGCNIKFHVEDAREIIRLITDRVK